MPNVFSAWPVANPTSDVQLYDWLTQIPRAIWERQWCTGNGKYWPPFNQPYTGGTITGYVDNGNGTVTFTDGSLAPAPPGQDDDGHYWNGTERPAGCTDQYWVGLDCTSDPPDLPWLASNYDVCIQVKPNGGAEWYRDMKPEQVVRGDLEATTSQTFRVRVNVQNWITAGYLSSAEQLVGAEYTFIKSGGLFWGGKDEQLSRYPDFPNDPELWRGVADEGKVYADGTGWLRQDAANAPTVDGWAHHRWAQPTPGGDPCEVLIYSGGELKRLAVTGNTSCKVFFGGLTQEQVDDPEWEEPEVDYLIDGSFTIVREGNRGWPERRPWEPWAFNASLSRGVYGHSPDDGLAVYANARIENNKTWAECASEICDCEDPNNLVHADLLDLDAYAAWVNWCEFSDIYWSPRFYKCLRHWQLGIEQIVSNFVRPQDYDGASEIVSYSRARAYHDCEINHGTGEVAAENSDDGGTNYYRTYYFVVNNAYKGVGVYYDVIKDELRITNNGNGTTTADGSTGRVIVATYTYGSSAARTADTATRDATWLGADVYYSAGWTRHFPLEFTSMYERCCLIPSETCDVGGCTADYPPSAQMDEEVEPPAPDCSKVGTWIWHGPSQGYKTFNDYGAAGDAAHTSGFPGFSVGDAARYTGFNYHEDRLHDAGGFTGNDDAALAPFWDRFFEGRFSNPVEVQMEEKRIGAVSGGEEDSPSGDMTLVPQANCIGDASKQWWTHWYTTNNGVAKQHTGLVTAGSTTSISIPNSYTDTTETDHCWFQVTRFNGSIFNDGTGATKPFKNFVLEVRKWHRKYAREGDRVYVGNGTETYSGTYDAGDPMTDINGDDWYAWHTYQLPITDTTDFNAVEGGGDDPAFHFEAVKNLAGDVVDFDPENDEEGHETQWTLNEPATNLNYYRGKRIRFTRPDNTTFELDITHNSNDMLFFGAQTDPQKIPQAGWQYEIVEQSLGGVWRWQTTEPTTEEKTTRKWQKVTYQYTDEEEETQTITGYWVQPIGADPRGADWKTDMTANEPHKRKAYGRIVKGDYIGADHIYSEMYKLLNRLVWTQTSVSWTSREDSDVPENNSQCGSALSEIQAFTAPYESELLTAIENAKTYTEANFLIGQEYPAADTCIGESNGAAPSAGIGYSVERSDATGGDPSHMFYAIIGSMGATYAYGVVSGVPNLIAHNVEMYAKATISTADDEPVFNFAEEGFYRDFADEQTDFELRVFKKFYDSPIDKNTNYKSTKIGGLDTPEWPPYDATEADMAEFISNNGPTPLFSVSVGYSVIAQRAIVKWNVTGGLRHIDTQA